MKFSDHASRARITVIASLAIVYLVWGATYAFNRVALETIPPFAMSGARFTIAGLLLAAILKVRGEPAVPRERIWAAVISGVFLLAGGNGLIVAAQHLGISSSIAALGAASSPLWVAVIGGLLGRPPTPREWAGLAVGFAGIAVLNHHPAGGSWLGMALLMGGALTWAIGSILIIRYPQPSGAMAPAIQMLSGGLCMVAISAVRHEPLRVPSEASLVALGLNIVFASIVAFIAYNYLLTTVRPALATSPAYVNPIIAAFIGAVLFRESLTVYDWGALALIVSGVILVAIQGKSSPSEPLDRPASDLSVQSPEHSDAGAEMG